MLAGLPKAPGANNPLSNPRAGAGAPALCDRPHAGDRLHHAPSRRRKPRRKNFTCAMQPTRPACTPNTWPKRCGRLMYAQYGDSTYTRGLKVYTVARRG